MSPAAAQIAKWRASPVAYVREVFGVEPQEWQAEVLAALPTEQRIAMKASKGVGKSTVLAWIVWWFLTVHRHPKVVCTSITGDNLKDGLWAELAKWQTKSPLLTNQFTWTAERVVCNDYHKTWFASARTWPKGGTSDQQSETLAGIHADHVLFVIDEAGGVPEAVVSAADAGLANADPAAGRTAMLALSGNPTKLSGPLHRACTRDRDQWFIKEISGDPDDPKRSPLVSKAWAQGLIDKWGRDSAVVRVNVFGQFPLGQSDVLISVDQAVLASQRRVAESEFHQEVKVLGVDVARFGDDRSVIFPRQGRVAMQPEVFRGLDTMQLAGTVARVIDTWKPDATFVDVIGIGAGVVDRLRQLGFAVIGADAGAKPPDNRFKNLRAAMWWNMAEWLQKGGGCIPDNQELISELCAPTYFFTSDKSQMQLESKDDIKARLQSSPDIADALALTFAAPVANRKLRQLQGAGHHGTVHEYNPLGPR